MGLDIDKIAAQRPTNQVYHFDSLASTMREATQLAAAGAPHGTVVLADQQTAGIGRFGRSWYSEAGVGIYCSLLLRLPIAADKLPLVTLALGLATAEAIQNVTDLKCDLRWPNDVLIRERKVAGIIAQLQDRCVIAGVGINVNHTQMPPDLRTPATSLLIESDGKKQSRESLIIALLAAVDEFLSVLCSEGSDAVLRAFAEASSYVMNRRVVLDETGEKGITAGLDPNGFLLIRYDSGRTERIASGGVRPEG